MNQANQHSAQSDDHEAPEPFVKTPGQLIKVVVLAFLVPIFVIVLLANYVTTGKKPKMGSDSLSPQATAQRIAPVAKLEVRDASAPQVLRTGEQVYSAQCVGCHGVGAAGAPKFGDTSAWGPRLGQGYAGLLNSALKGKGLMSAQGGGEYADLEVGRAVVHMANAAGGKLAEPTPAAAETPATPAAAPAAK